MWNAIAQDIAQAIKNDFVITQTKQVCGGDTNTAFHITDNNHQFFVKLNQKQYLSAFQNESFALEHLAVSEQLIVPKVITCGTTLNYSYLVLEFLEMHTSSLQMANEQWFALGEGLAILHGNNQQAEFGWTENNYIGLTVQSNIWQQNWSRFFAEQRIGYQLQLLQDKGIQLGRLDVLTDICQQLLAHRRPIPSLVHGDLWQGNVSFVDGKPCMFDPASYYGDREVDIAMTELFGRFPAAFYQGYNHTFPLDKDYQYRKHIYNGYHILNHANLFAGIYINQAKSFINDLHKYHQMYVRNAS
ncbi:fructosamine kinase family protein [Colwelliaceae bacterium BS250]